MRNKVSSNSVRLYLRRGLSVKYLVHDDCIKYIYQNELYDSSLVTNIDRNNSEWEKVILVATGSFNPPILNDFRMFGEFRYFQYNLQIFSRMDILIKHLKIFNS